MRELFTRAKQRLLVSNNMKKEKQNIDGEYHFVDTSSVNELLKNLDDEKRKELTYYLSQIEKMYFENLNPNFQISEYEFQRFMTSYLKQDEITSTNFFKTIKLIYERLNNFITIYEQLKNKI
jgi:hypothetical protein